MPNLAEAVEIENFPLRSSAIAVSLLKPLRSRTTPMHLTADRLSVEVEGHLWQVIDTVNLYFTEGEYLYSDQSTTTIVTAHPTTSHFFAIA